MASPAFMFTPAGATTASVTNKLVSLRNNHHNMMMMDITIRDASTVPKPMEPLSSRMNSATTTTAGSDIAPPTKRVITNKRNNTNRGLKSVAGDVSTRVSSSAAAAAHKIKLAGVSPVRSPKVNNKPATTLKRSMSSTKKKVTVKKSSSNQKQKQKRETSPAANEVPMSAKKASTHGYSEVPLRSTETRGKSSVVCNYNYTPVASTPVAAATNKLGSRSSSIKNSKGDESPSIFKPST